LPAARAVQPAQGIAANAGRHLPEAAQHGFHALPGGAMCGAAMPPSLKRCMVGRGQGFGLEAHEPARRFFQNPRFNDAAHACT
jgi:hypothetical protein